MEREIGRINIYVTTTLKNKLLMGVIELLTVNKKATGQCFFHICYLSGINENIFKTSTISVVILSECWMVAFLALKVIKFYIMRIMS